MTLVAEGDWRKRGLDRSWSTTLDVDGHDGERHRWHLLDRPAVGGAGTEHCTVVCVHGNPTWSYAWSRFLRDLPDEWRVVAVDQLGMGFSERTDGPRRYRDRIADLDDVLSALDLSEAPLVVAGHDWGGAIAMGFAVHTDRAISGLVLCNTGIAVPEGRSAPRLIQLAGAAPLRDLVCRRTRVFVDGTIGLSWRRLTSIDRKALRDPYRTSDRRAAIADFVGDVPLSSPHPSEGDLADVADRLGDLDAPVLLAWGASDPVFDDSFADDLAGRFRDVSIHRFARAGHLVTLEADVASVAADFVLDRVLGARPEPRPVLASGADGLTAAIERRATDDHLAVSDLAAGESSTFRDFARRVDNVAAGLRQAGVEPGDRIGLLTPPSVDLLAVAYGVWRAGAVAVVADRGLGLRGLGRALGSARPSWLIGPRAARAASSVLRWAPQATFLDVASLVESTAPRIADDDRPAPQDPAAVLFTSGATGPAKGVRYTHGQLTAQRDALAATYGITGDDRLVAAFAPFSLYGPALGIPTALPDCDVTAPGSLTHAALAAAVDSVDATLVFASPTAIRNVVETAGDTDDRTAARVALSRVRTLMSAGAPVPAELLGAASDLVPNAEIHTPYGMTETLPVADIDLDSIRTADADDPVGGVCVGRPVAGVDVRVVPVDFDALAGVPDGLRPGELGEVLVRAPWTSAGYDRLWDTERNARPGAGWHRTGDVGHLDDSGRLWIGGRSVHVIHAVDGPVASVPVERVVERSDLPGVVAGRVAALGVGPVGIQQLVIVLERPDGDDAPLAALSVADRVRRVVRAGVGLDVAAVLTRQSLPVDIRHEAKIDRSALADWASTVLAGEAVER